MDVQGHTAHLSLWWNLFCKAAYLLKYFGRKKEVKIQKNSEYGHRYALQLICLDRNSLWQIHYSVPQNGSEI